MQNNPVDQIQSKRAVPYMFIGIVLILLVVAGGSVYFLCLNTSSDIVAPDDGRKIDVARSDVVYAENAPLPSSAHYGFFLSSHSPKDILTFYENELHGKGWGKFSPVSTNPPKIIMGYFYNTTNALILSIVGPLEDTDGTKNEHRKRIPVVTGQNTSG